MNDRLNIGFLINDQDKYFTSQACRGAELAAKALDANLFIFPGHYIGRPDSNVTNNSYEYQYNAVFTLPSKANVDIIYILMGAVCSRADYEEQREFLESLPKVPIVCLYSSFEGYYSVNFDNKSGFKESLVHLIKKHGARDIGFVSGPLTNRDASERLEVYKSTLEEYALEVSDSKIVFGDFSEDCAEALGNLLDNNEHLDAIVFANDTMAIGGYKTLEERGIIPGKDILVTGFDNDSTSKFLDPPLTTVQANSADLTYKAVINARNYIDGTELTDMTMETQFIQRNSCGCARPDFHEICARLRLNELESGAYDISDTVAFYLFGLFVNDKPVENVRKLVEEFCNAYVELVSSDDIDASCARLDETFFRLVRSNFHEFTTHDNFITVLTAMRYEAAIIIKDKLKLDKVKDLFADFYLVLSFTKLESSGKLDDMNERLSRMINQQTMDIFLGASENGIRYEQLLEGNKAAGFSKSLLYVFQGNIRNYGEKNWKCPSTMLLVALSDSDGVRAIDEEQQLLHTELLFTNEYAECGKRRTMIVSPLFVGIDFYGLLVNELDLNFLSNVSTISFQLSMTLKTLIMMEAQNKIKQNLQSSLEHFIKDNTKLEIISKIDELTGLFNRRGLLSKIEDNLNNPANNGKTALICYADLDNLKMINDKFGHEEGDYAICTVTKVLHECFRSDDVLGRIGGDEFVVFAIMNSDFDENAVAERIGHVMERFSKDSGKPYPIDASVGIQKFVCSPSVDIYKELEVADGKLRQIKLEKKKRNGSYR